MLTIFTYLVDDLVCDDLDKVTYYFCLFDLLETKIKNFHIEMC